MITSLYFIFTTFSSVGYGDVLAVTPDEQMYAMLVEMLGICFFGYMIGLFQSIMIGITDSSQEQNDAVDYFLMKIDKCVKDRSLDDLNVYAGVRIFFSNNLKYDIQAVVQSPEF
jgi:hypothetical protein